MSDTEIKTGNSCGLLNGYIIRVMARIREADSWAIDSVYTEADLPKAVERAQFFAQLPNRTKDKVKVIRLSYEELPF